ncbi:EamA family transporter RarD [Paracoccaceae bacterium GXU_MW_L88]
MTVTTPADREVKIGILSAAGVCVCWGLSMLYYKAVDHVPPLEVLAHRTVWSLVFFVILLTIQGRMGELKAALRDRHTVISLLIAALLISQNWFGFIFAIQIERAMEASFGYYIFPIVAVILGAIFYRERLRPVQIVAVLLAVAAVLTLAFGLGVTPWISLWLATTMGFYGMAKRATKAGPVLSVAVEVLLISPIALAWLIAVHGWDVQGLVDRPGGWFGENWRDTLLLIGSGPLTGGPLILFAMAARRLTYATMGLIMYLNPTIQFLVAAIAFGEPVTGWHMIAFPLIWLALAIYSADALARERSARKRAINAAGP